MRRWLRDNKDMILLIGVTIALILIVTLVLGIIAFNQVEETRAFKQDCLEQSGTITESKHSFTHLQAISNGKTTTWVPMRSTRTVYICTVNGEVVGSHP